LGGHRQVVLVEPPRPKAMKRPLRQRAAVGVECKTRRLAVIAASDSCRQR
jgi:hypothetical protein